MKEYLTGYSIANEIRMTRSLYAGAFLIVEGPQTDFKVFVNFIEPKRCQLIPAHGKENAILANRILEQDKITGVLTIVDADFWRLQGILPDNGNLLLTDSHDLETMILNSPALEKLLLEHASQGKLKRLNQGIRQLLLERGCEIGSLRFVSIRENLNLKFEDLDFAQFVSRKDLSLNRRSMVRHVKQKSTKHNLSEHELVEKVEQVINEKHNLWDLCCGHDLVNILSLGLRNFVGSNNANDVKLEVLEKDLRLAYEFLHFVETELHQAIRDWESRNQPFKVLRQNTVST